MIKMKITLSIIIPMYNTEQTIGRCLDSIERQQVDFPFEIIVVDDGSTDDSVGSIETYQKRFTNIKLFKQQNMKQSAARNNGLNHAKGDYVMFFAVMTLLKMACCRSWFIKLRLTMIWSCVVSKKFIRIRQLWKIKLI